MSFTVYYNIFNRLDNKLTCVLRESSKPIVTIGPDLNISKVICSFFPYTCIIDLSVSQVE